MSELDPLVLWAVFDEMLGPVLWLLLGVALIGGVAFVALLVRERSVSAHRLVRAQAVGVLGGVLALVVMAQVSSSGFTDAGGPVDWLLIALVFLVGLAASAVLFYTVAGWRTVCRAGRLT